PADPRNVAGVGEERPDPELRALRQATARRRRPRAGRRHILAVPGPGLGSRAVVDGCPRRPDPPGHAAADGRGPAPAVGTLLPGAEASTRVLRGGDQPLQLVDRSRL